METDDKKTTTTTTNSSANNQKKLGTIAPAVVRDSNVNRLSRIRPNPDLTLGGVKKREFLPNVPSAPHIPKKKEEPRINETTTRVPFDKNKRFNNNNSNPRQNDRQFKKPTPNINTTTSRQTTVSPFAAGPPSTATESFKSLSLDDSIERSHESITRDTVKQVDKVKPSQIDPLNLSHPLVLPLVNPTENLKSKVKQDPVFNLQGLTPDEFMKEDELCLFQMPSMLPINASAPVKEKPKEGTKKAPESVPLEEQQLEHVNNLTAVPDGYLGKLQIYKSGKMKMKIGDYLYEVKPGTESTFLQQVVYISSSTKQCFELGNLSKRYIAIPDMASFFVQENIE